MNKILTIKDLSKEYPLPKGTLQIFDRLSFELNRGELIAIMGISGVGKTTLLNLIGLLDKPTSGEIYFAEENVLIKGEREKAEIRNKKVGFIFQFYHLLPEFTALENVSFPLLIAGVRKNGQ